MFDKIKQSLGINKSVMAISIARMGDAIGNSILIIVIPIYVAKLPLPWFPFSESIRVGLLISLYGLASAVLQPVMGGLTDRLGKRKLMVSLGLVLMAMATSGFILAGRFADLIVLRFLQGLGVAITVPASLAIMASATQQKSRGGAMSIYSTMRMVGFATGPLIGGYIYDKYGFSATFVIGTIFILIGLVMVWLLLEKDPVISIDKDGKKPPISSSIFDRELLTAGIIGASLATFIMASDYSMISTLENEFNARLNQTALGFGIAFSALITSRLIFQVPLGNLSDHWGRKPLILLGLLLMAPATGFLGNVTSTAQFTGLRVIQGLASAAIAAPAFALAADISKPGGEGRQMSIVTMGFGLGIAIGPLISGLLAVYSFALPFWFGALLTLMVAWIVFRYVPETLSRNSQQVSKSSAAD